MRSRPALLSIIVILFLSPMAMAGKIIQLKCVGGENKLHIRGDNGSRCVLPLGSGDSHRGFSWDGTDASYVIYTSGVSKLIIRRFDGEEFSGGTQVIELGSGDTFRGWHWDGTYATWIQYKGGENTLFRRRFDGKEFSGSYTAGIEFGSGDVFRGLTYNGTYLWYVENQNDRLIKRRFDGTELSGGTDVQNFPNASSIRGYERL